MAPQSTVERLVRLEEQVKGLGTQMQKNHTVVSTELHRIADVIQNGKLIVYRLTEMEEKVDALEITTDDLDSWRNTLNGKIAMLLGLVAFVVVAVQILAAFL